jgi:hypothetical protein
MKSSAAKKYRRQAKEAVEAENVENAPWALVGVKAEFRFKNDCRRDQDNAVASIKAAYDGIVDAGLVLNDDYDHMKREMPEFSVDKKNPCVILTIRNLTVLKE